MAKPSHDPNPPRLLVVELWGLGDLALAVPFLRAAAAQARVTLLARPHAAPLLARFAPGVEHVPLAAPWTAFVGKYRFHHWPWRELTRARRTLREKDFALGVSARPDPRDHALLALAGARRRLGFPRAGSRILLTDPLPPPPRLHRAEHWRTLAAALGWPFPISPLPWPELVERPSPLSHDPALPRRIVLHTGAGQPVRAWPRDRFEALAARLRAAGWHVSVLDDSLTDIPQLLDALAAADRFIGNDSGPGHLAALLGVPTFTIFGPQLPEFFAPQHPRAAWLDGAPCPYKPCFDSCRFPQPNCLLAHDVDTVWSRVQRWLAA